MDIQEFRKDFLEEVKATAATEGEGSNSAFVSVVMSYLSTAEVFEEFTPAFYTGTGKRNRKLRIDGYSFDEFDLTFNLMISDYSGEDERDTLVRTYAESIFDKAQYFLEETFSKSFASQIEPSTPVSDLVDLLFINKDRIRKYRIVLLTDGIMSSRINELPSASINEKKIEYQIWDMERLYRVCCSSLGRQSIEIDFNDYTNGVGIPSLAANETNNDDYKSYLCIISGKTLADIYDAYGSQLLEGNVRSFLSTKVAVNKKIRETILNSPKNFFAYNNGVSATATEIKFDDKNNIIFAKDFQIINGGQTTASLSSAQFKDKADLKDIYVQMKLTVIAENADIDKTNDLVRNISRSSNSQNKVSDADFFATHPFHVRMEQISRRVFAPATGGAQYETKWFYERARGQYLQCQMRMTKSQKDKFKLQNPKKQVITKTDFAKYRSTWDMKPQLVSKGAQTNFLKYAEVIDNGWAGDDSKYNDRYFKETVALAILFKRTEEIVSHQPWYENGYRANIVTYSIALLRKLIKEQFANKDLDLQQIWNRQKVPDIVDAELAEISKFVFEKITDPSRGVMNVTQWCKKDDCWTDVKKCDIKLSDDMDDVLVSVYESQKENYEAKKDQKIVSEFEMQNYIIGQGAEFWAKALSFINQKKYNLPITKLKALEAATKIPNKIPSTVQCKMIMETLEILKENGFNGE